MEMKPQKVKEKVEDKAEAKPEAPACHHYWVIEVANGPRSQGKCKICETKEFYNAFPDINPIQRKANPLDLPKLPEVEIDKESES